MVKEKDFNMERNSFQYENRTIVDALALNTSGISLSTNMNKLLILDLDGTLYDFDNGKTNNFKKSRFYQEVKSNACKFIAKKRSISFTEAKKVYERIFEEFNGEISIGIEKIFGINRYDYFKAAFNLKPQDFIAKKDLLPFIKKLKTSVAILTSAPRVWAEPVLDYLNLGEYKNKLFTGEPDIRKPSALAFKQVCDSLRFSPINCISIGDQVETDILPAKSIGMKTILVKKSSPEADFSISSLEELPKVLKLI